MKRVEFIDYKGEGKFALKQTSMAERGSRGIAILFL